MFHKVHIFRLAVPFKYSTWTEPEPSLNAAQAAMRGTVEVHRSHSEDQQLITSLIPALTAVA